MTEYKFPPRNKAEEMLFRHTIILSTSSSRCGNCNANAFPDKSKCEYCGTSFVFSAVSYTKLIDGRAETTDEAQPRVEALCPKLIFVGRVGRGGPMGRTNILADIPTDEAITNAAEVRRQDPWAPSPIHMEPDSTTEARRLPWTSREG